MALKICLATLYTAEIAELAALTNPSKDEYCRMRGYAFECHEGSLDTTRHPAWSKIRHVRNLLDRYDWVFWLDADALIMNPEIRAEDLIDDRYDLVIAKQPGPDPWGRVHLNTGSFLLRSCAWSRGMLDDLYAQTQFLEHPAWDQEAFFYLYRTRSEVRERTKVEIDPRRLNAGASSYTKGDFAFHALTPLRTEAGKLDLIRQVLASDAGIAESVESGIDVALLHFDEELCDLLEFTVPSLLLDSAATESNPIRFIKTFDRAFTDAFGWEDLNRYWFEAVLGALETTTASHLVVPRAGSHFFPGWRRRLLVAIGSNDVAIATDPTGREFRDDVLLLRRTDASRRFLERGRDLLPELPTTLRATRKAIPAVFHRILESSGEPAEVAWTELPPELVRIGSASGLSGFDLVRSAVYSRGQLEGDRERADVRAVRSQVRSVLESMRETIIETPPRRADRGRRLWNPWRQLQRRRTGPPPTSSGPERPRA